ncbi:cytochrome c3 family protein [Verrucomicrobiota bacterium sgz303538]
MRRTSKQIAEKYKGNLDYFRKPHYLRRLRGWAFAIAVIGSLSAALGFYYFGGKPEFFNTGPLSANHAQFANRCEVCHADSQPDLAKVTKLDRAVEQIRKTDLEALKALPSKAGELAHVVQVRAGGAASTLSHALSLDAARDAVSKLSEQYAESSHLSRMDRACLQCHDAFSLHQPQSAALSLRPVAQEISVVHAAGCAICHREHEGPQPMKVPAGESCESCHNQPQQLAKTLELVKTTGPLASKRAEIRDFGDGVRRFIPPRDVPHQPVAFKSFEKGHPAFGYEKPGLRDPAAIKFNHWRHEQADIPLVNGRRLDCSNCHKPGANGQFFQRVDYEQHCAECHSLHFDPDVPKLAIPHGDPEKVRDYLRSLTTQYVDYAMKERGMTDRAQLQEFVKGQFDKLRARGMTTAEELERRVFYTGDPPETPDRVMTKSNKGQFFAGCAKCHEITPAAVSGAPKITPTNMADRWLTRGPFTHAEHAHVACIDCHGAAKTSKLTTDILMPTRQSCTECHRPLDGDKVQPLKTAAAEEMVAKQRKEGGIAAECQSCHKFHAPAEASRVLVKAQP